VLKTNSLGDMELYFASIDELLQREQMPIEYKDHKSLIYCSDCERKSTTKFHFVYHKVWLAIHAWWTVMRNAHRLMLTVWCQCQFDDCGSYNTKLLRQFKDPGEHCCGGAADTDAGGHAHH